MSYLCTVCSDRMIQYSNLDQIKDSDLSFNKRGTSIISSNFIHKISNVFQSQHICGPSGENYAFSAEYKSKSNDNNHLNLIQKWIQISL